MKKIKIIAILFLVVSVLAFVFCPLLPFVKNKVDLFGCAFGAFVFQNKIIFILKGLALAGSAFVFGSVYNCEDSENARVCNNCPEDELNKVVHVAFVKRGQTVTTSSAALFVSSILTLEKNCLAKIIRNVSGMYDGGKATKGKGAGKQVSRILGKKHTLTFTDFDYVANVAFWNSFEDAAQNYDLYYFTDTYGWVAASTFISVEAQGPVTDNNETFIEGNIIVEWSFKKTPLPYKADVDELSGCQELFDSSLKTFSNRSGSQAIVTGSAGSQSAAIGTGQTFGIELITNVTLGSAKVTDISNALPAGLAVTISGTKVIISGTPTAAGSSLVTIAACNACNICSEVSITIVVS